MSPTCERFCENKHTACSLAAVTASLDSIGNVTSLRSDADNITSQFYDTQSRLNSYKTQEERLLDMLSKADNVSDMIEIETRLADIRYQVESLTTTLRNWQNAVDYSTLTLYINEVAELTEITPVQPRSYWQQISDGLKANTKSVGAFFKNLFKWIVINLLVLIILAVLAIIAFIFIRKYIKRANTQAKQRPQYYYDPVNHQYRQNHQNARNQEQPHYQQGAPEAQGESHDPRDREE